MSCLAWHYNDIKSATEIVNGLNITVPIVAISPERLGVKSILSIYLSASATSFRHSKKLRTSSLTDVFEGAKIL